MHRPGIDFLFLLPLSRHWPHGGPRLRYVMRVGIFKGRLGESKGEKLRETEDGKKKEEKGKKKEKGEKIKRIVNVVIGK